MDATRRDVMGMAGGVAAAAMLARSAPLAAGPKLGSPAKTMDWVGAVTPGDKGVVALRLSRAGAERH